MKTIGLGNPLVDVLLRLKDDNVLTEVGARKGSMELINRDAMLAIRKAQEQSESSLAPGGSMANTMRAMAALGAETGYIGKLGTDALGTFYENEMKKAGVRTNFIKIKGESGSSTVLISPDGERTMATFLGPAATLCADDLMEEVICEYDCLYIEGYLIINEPLVRRAIELGKKHGLWIALDLASFNVVEEKLDFLREIVPASVDVLFCNESEAKMFTGLPAEQAVRIIARQTEIAVVTVGKEGALIGVGEQVVSVPATSEAVPVDTTGAGDHFAAGFLYGFTRNASVEQSGRIGALLAGTIIGVVGAKIPDEQWEQLKLKVSNILA